MLYLLYFLWGQSDWNGALNYYTKSISVFLWFERGADKSVDDISFVSTLEQLTNADAAMVSIDTG